MKQVLGRILVVGALLVVGAAATTAHRNPPAANAGAPASRSAWWRSSPRLPAGFGLADFVRFTPNSQWLTALQTAYPPPAGSVANKAAQVLMVADMPSLGPVAHRRRLPGLRLCQGPRRRIGRDKARQTIFVLFIPCASPHGMDPFSAPLIIPASTRRGTPRRATRSPTSSRRATRWPCILNDASSFDGHTTAAGHELARRTPTPRASAIGGCIRCIRATPGRRPALGARDRYHRGRRSFRRDCLVRGRPGDPRDVQVPADLAHIAPPTASTTWPCPPNRNRCTTSAPPPAAGRTTGTSTLGRPASRSR